MIVVPKVGRLTEKELVVSKVGSDTDAEVEVSEYGTHPDIVSKAGLKGARLWLPGKIKSVPVFPLAATTKHDFSQAATASSVALEKQRAGLVPSGGYPTRLLLQRAGWPIKLVQRMMLCKHY